MPPRTAAPARRSASVSPCGRPPRCVQPRPTTYPFLTMTQPTDGLGQTVPRPRRASASAACIMARSVEAFCGVSVADGRPPSIVIRRDPPDEFAEILGLAEIAVDRGKADIGDLVERRQRLHDQLADHVARDVGFARAFELAHQRIDDALDAVGLDRALAQRDVDRAGQLVAVERLALRVLLDDRQLTQLHSLEGREAGAATDAEPPAPDRAAILGRPRILDLGVIRGAERTAHFLLLIPRAALPRTVVSSSVRGRSHGPVNRKSGAQRRDGAAHALLDRGIAAGVVRQAAQHVADPEPDLTELGDAKPARRRRGRAEAAAGRHRRLLRVERNAVLVAGDAGALQRLLRVAASQPERA